MEEPRRCWCVSPNGRAARAEAVSIQGTRPAVEAAKMPRNRPPFRLARYINPTLITKFVMLLPALMGAAALVAVAQEPAPSCWPGYMMEAAAVLVA